MALVLGLIAGNLQVPVAAQSVTATTGAVNGIVTDSTKAVVPGVTVSLSGPSLMTTRIAVTDEAGAYRFSGVPTGDHTLTFTLAGFATIVREGIHVGLGFTATVNAEMSPGTVTDGVIVRGSPIVDVTSTEVTTHFDAETLSTLPGARDIFALLANTPGIAMSKMDVGGNGALALQEYTAYGLRATTGVNRNEVEGIRVGGANGNQDNYLSDFASFAEIAIKAVGQTAAMSVPGTLSQYVSKSGGDTYHGSLYADFQSDRMEATNIDNAQIARGVSGGPGLDARDVNRLEQFPRLHCGRRWVREKRQGVVVRRVPLVGGGAAVPVAARHGGHTRSDSRNWKGHVPAIPATQARRLSAARDLQAVEFFRCRARASRSRRAMRCRASCFP